MEPFSTHLGRAVPLRRSDVDTDQIIPSEWLKRVQRSGFGAGLFAQWRSDGAFVLDRPEYVGASILVAGENFGTGSSREHAVWALQDYGFRVVVSSRFGDIFSTNAGQAGLLAVVLPADVIESLMATVEANPTTDVSVDLQSRQVSFAGRTATFAIENSTRERLLGGLDEIAVTERFDTEIGGYERMRPPWLPVVRPC